MNKDKKIKRLKKTGILGSIISGIILFMFIAFVVSVIYLVFTAYVFSEFYVDGKKNSENVNKLYQKHIEHSLDQINNYASGIEGAFLDEGGSGDNKFIEYCYNIIKADSQYTNIGIKFYDKNLEEFGNIRYFITNTDMYNKALQDRFGISYETINETDYITYTSPIVVNNVTIGFVYATEQGNISNLAFDFQEEDSTGIRACYIINAQNNVIAYSGYGNMQYDYYSIERQVKDESSGITMEIESAVTKLGIDNENINIMGSMLDSYRKQFTDSKTSFKNLVDGEGVSEISKVWYKQQIGNTGLYTWTLSVSYIESATSAKLIMGLAITLIVLMVPFLVLIISTIVRIIENRKMLKLVYLDDVTSCGNWLLFEETAGKILKKRKNRDSKFAMVSFEINKFRIICDYYGEGFAYEILGFISKELKKYVNKNELYSRYAESQYGLLLEYNEINELTKRVDNILNTLTGKISDKKISFRAGIYLIDDKSMSISTINLIACGAKDTCATSVDTEVVMYNSDIREKQLKEKLIEDTMELALKNKEFYVFLQPKYKPNTNEMAGAEALVRWINPQKKMISPGEFIPTFEKNGFITKLDDYMLEEVSKLQARWINEGKNVVPISVNISRAHFANEKLAEHILEIVDKFNIPHNIIELELTESAFFDDKEMLLKTVNKLHKYGFMVSMDDFGAGYSSLNSLKDLPLDIIKLDGEFFNESDDKTRSETVVKNTITLAKNLNMKIVAEGIETKEQVDFLERQGCDLIQGFFYARPMPVNDFERLRYTAENTK